MVKQIKKRAPKSSGLDIIGKRHQWYKLSLAILVPCLISLLVFGLNLGIDFTGGSSLELKGQASGEKIVELAKSNGSDKATVTSGQNNTWLLTYKPSGDPKATQEKLEVEYKKTGLEVVRSDQVGPSVSEDLAKNALMAIGLMSLAIVIYISWAFRKVPKSVKPYRFGLATLLAAFAHDALIVLGVFALLGEFFNVQFDSYIVTAILTVIGFSIHDTIVVFDRIREKLKGSGRNIEKFPALVNDSINETIARSLNTSLVIILVLLALYLFGGPSIRYFVLALLLGMLAGTYSSIFIASPLLVSWHQRSQK